MAIAITITACSGGDWLTLIGQVVSGTLMGVGSWTFNALLEDTFTWQGLGAAAVDAFLVTSIFVFVYSCFNPSQYDSRSYEYSQEFSDWLDKGDKNNVVYKAVDKNSNKEVYTGITRQTTQKRLSQHIRAGKPFKELKTYCKGLTRNQARSIETYLILTDGASQMNKILSISRNNRFFNEAMCWAKLFVGG